MPIFGRYLCRADVGNFKCPPSARPTAPLEQVVSHASTLTIYASEDTECVVVARETVMRGKFKKPAGGKGHAGVRSELIVWIPGHLLLTY